MLNWNRLPDGGDWLNRSNTSLSNGSSSLSSANAAEQRVKHNSSRALKSSSSSSANAAEHRLKQQRSPSTAKKTLPQNRLPDGGDWLKRSQTSPSTRSSSFGSANAAEHRLNQQHPPSTAKKTLPQNRLPDGGDWLKRSQTSPSTRSSSFSSANAAEHRLKPNSAKALNSSSSSSANAVEHRLQQHPASTARKTLPKNRLPDGGDWLKRSQTSPSTRSSSFGSANKEKFDANYRPDLHPTPVSAANFRLAEERSKLSYDQNRTKLDAEVQQTVQQIRQQRPKPEQKKHWWDKAGDVVKENTSDAWDKTKSVGSYVKDHAETIGHTALDGAGFIPVVGGVADLANAGWYAVEGDKVNAALSAASAIPFAGDAFAAGKLATKGIKLAKDAKGTRTIITSSGDPRNVADFEKLKAQLAAQEIEAAPATGRALTNDALHRAASFVTDTVEQGQHFTFKNTDFPRLFDKGDGKWKSLSQVEGGMDGKKGIFEYIVDSNGNLTHQRFIEGGKRTGFPNQIPKKLR